MAARCDVLVVGGGPAGSMTAWKLARAGVDTLVVDRSTFPRDKVCGDALLPDALQALDESGLADAVGREALAVDRAVFRSPGGQSLRVKGRFLTITREKLDALLLGAAIDAGARFLPGYEVLRPEVDARGLCGVEGRTSDGETLTLSCRTIVLCCGSSPRLLRAFDVLTRPLHSAIAIRGYLPFDPFPAISSESLPELRPASGSRSGPRDPSGFALSETPRGGVEGDPHDAIGQAAPSLLISYERTLLPGYGWSFPLPGGMWNVGCGVFLSSSPRRRLPLSRGTRGYERATRAGTSSTEDRPLAGGRLAPAPRASSRPQKADANLRGLLRTFLRSSVAGNGGGSDEGSTPAGARDLLPDWWSTVRGSTLRTGFTGSLPISVPGGRAGQVLVAGEALGLTLPLTGDGIGKAMQSGLIAGDVIAGALARSRTSPDYGAYPRALETRIRPTQSAYAAAQRWMRYPAVSDLIVQRAARSPRLRALVEEILAETADPRALLSPAGLLRALIT